MYMKLNLKIKNTTGQYEFELSQIHIALFLLTKEM